MKGLPTYPDGQTQFGVWLTTLHSAIWPQIPGQGSLHFLFKQAKWFAHSLLLTHSGLQFGGDPSKSGKQEHEGELPWTLHIEFSPQGLGKQGSFGSANGFSIIGWHRMKGSPVFLEGQLQMGLWLTTWQVALTPHVPGQGSMHFWFRQARLRAHSEFVMHSGLHEGGVPKYPGTQEHTACPFTSRHWLLGPQGLGTHWFLGISSETKIYSKVNEFQKWFVILPLILLQSTNAFPSNPCKQEHIGMWFMTEQTALVPQVPGQGSIHLYLLHALSWGQSLLSKHSGLHSLYGSPM